MFSVSDADRYLDKVSNICEYSEINANGQDQTTNWHSKRSLRLITWSMNDVWISYSILQLWTRSKWTRPGMSSSLTNRNIWYMTWTGLPHADLKDLLPVSQMWKYRLSLRTKVKNIVGIVARSKTLSSVWKILFIDSGTHIDHGTILLELRNFVNLAKFSDLFHFLHEKERPPVLQERFIFEEQQIFHRGLWKASHRWASHPRSSSQRSWWPAQWIYLWSGLDVSVAVQKEACLKYLFVCGCLNPQ